MNPKINYALVGLFVVVFSGALIAWVFWLSVGIEKKTYATYVAYMSQSVAGLNTNAEVKYRGVQVGKVKSITLDQANSERVQLLLDIEAGTPIKQDSIAVLTTQGITGLGYIDLSGGSREAPFLKAKDDQLYPEIKTGPSLFVRMDKALSELFIQFTTIVQEISGVSAAVKNLLNEQNLHAINQTLQNTAQATQQLNKHMESLSKHLEFAESILKNVAVASAEFPDTAQQVSASAQSVQQLITKVSQSVENFDAAVSGTQQQISRSAADSLAQTAQLFEELQRTTQTLNRLLQDFERNPNMFIFGRKAERAGPGENQR